MRVHVDLTQQTLHEILRHTYVRVQETEDLKVKDVIEEIRQQFLMYKKIEEKSK